MYRKPSSQIEVYLQLSQVRGLMWALFWSGQPPTFNRNRRQETVHDMQQHPTTVTVQLCCVIKERQMHVSFRAQRLVTYSKDVMCDLNV
jgi:hypothetical protein